LKEESCVCLEIGFLKAQLRSSLSADENQRLLILQRFLELERQSKASALDKTGTLVKFPSPRLQLKVLGNDAHGRLIGR
jgi:hypothetical protein